MSAPHPFLDPATQRKDGIIRNLGDADGEFTAVCEGAGVFDLSHRDRLLFVGEDCAPFLNRLLTYEVTRLEPGQGARPFLLDARGRIRAAFNLLRIASDRFWVDSAPATGEAVCAALDMYHFGERFEMSPLSTHTTLSVQGPKAAAVLSDAGLPVPNAPWSHAETETDAGLIRVARIDRCRGPGYDLWMPRDAVDGCITTLEAAGAVAAGADTLEMLRIEAGRADSPAEFGEHSSPLELNAFDGLTDGKGCYPGQEVIERTISLGKPPRKLVPIVMDSTATVGSNLTEGERTVGTLTSVARLPSGQWVALALIKRRSADADAWTYGDIVARRR